MVFDPRSGNPQIIIGSDVFLTITGNTLSQECGNVILLHCKDRRPDNPVMPDDTRYLAVLAVLPGCQGLDVYKDMLPKALDSGLTSVMVKEMVYRRRDCKFCIKC